MDYYGMDGNPISMDAWRELWLPENFEKCRRVASDYVGDYYVSTVLLGTDHSFGIHKIHERPIIFETMVFKKDNGDVYMDRYSTKEEALKGHNECVEYAKTLNEGDEWMKEYK